MSLTNYWGRHLVMNARSCYPHAIRNAIVIEKFCADLVREIDMVPYGKPQIVHFGTGEAKGYTLVQLIETSNITAHFSEKTNDMYLDVFSCKDFEAESVKRVVRRWMIPVDIESYELLR